MYSTLPFLNVPEDEHATIWRYMGFAKFVSLLDKKALHFTRSDKFDDKFEGAIPKPTIKAREALVLETGTPLVEETLKVWSQGSQEVRKWIFVNCWHINNNESAGMWKWYVQNNEGIAIRSTFARLRDSMSSPYHIVMGIVNYINHDEDMIPYDNAFHAFFCKKRSFEHERELRAAFFKPSETNNSLPGLPVSCDLNILIDEIFVSPGSSNWYKETANAILEKYSLDREVKPSSLDEKPLY